MSASPRNRQSGITLVEAMVATAVFSIVLLTVLAVYHFSGQSYRRGEAASDAQQTVRSSFNNMMKDLRLTGFDYNRDGDDNPYPDSTDEQIEYSGPHAITIRGNMDYASNGGREDTLEMDPANPAFGASCCPIVTTGNDEIVTYALVSMTPSANNGTIAIKTDIRPTNARDAVWNDDGEIVNEETLVLTGVDLTGDNPPYKLYRYSVNAAGNGFDSTLLAENIKALDLTYKGADGLEYYCRTGDGAACLEGDKLWFNQALGGDDLTAGDEMRRTVRAAVREYQVKIVGLESPADKQYRDPAATLASADQKTIHYRKFTLTANVFPANLGKKGSQDLASAEADRPSNVVVTGGQCRSVRVSWLETSNAVRYQIQLFNVDESTVDPFYVTEVTGALVPDSSPRRLFRVFDSNDHASIQHGVRIMARIAGVNMDDQTGNPSAPSNVTTLQDVTRPDPPFALTATGYEETHPNWPDTSTMMPVSIATDDDYPQTKAILLRWKAPQYVLDVQDQTDPLTSATTRITASTLAALDLASQPGADLDGDTLNDHYRTPVWELHPDKTYLIFRSTDPFFVPTDSDLVGVTNGLADGEGGLLGFKDKTKHEWDPAGAWLRTPNAMACCRPFYYRIRTADACWDGNNPSARTGPAKDHLSPFFPKINPDPNAVNSDTGNTGNPALAIPGYAIPSAKAKPPANLRYHDLDNTTADGDPMDFIVAFDAVKKDQNNPSLDSAYEKYVLYSHPSDPNFTVSNLGVPTSGGRLERTIRAKDLRAQRIDRDDENNNGQIDNGEDETSRGQSGNTDLVIGLTDQTPRWYRIAAMHCESDSIAKSGNDIYAWDYGALSPAMRIPCQFGGGPSSVNVSAYSWPNSVLGTAIPYDPTVNPTYGRLILKVPSTGDGAISADPGLPPDYTGGTTFTFNAEHIRNLTQQFAAGSPILVAAEIQDRNGCFQRSDYSLQTVELPTCCVGFPYPVVRLDGTAVSTSIGLREFCNADPLFISYMSFSLGNENGGKAEKIQRVFWNSTLLRNINAPAGSIDRSQSPLKMSPLERPVLRIEFDKAVTGNTLTINMNYLIQNRSGYCSATSTSMSSQ